MVRARGYGKGRVAAFVFTLAVGVSLVAGCSASVTIGGTPSVPRQTVATQVATTLAHQLNQPVPKVVCPTDLRGKVGTVIYCSLTPQGSTTTYPVKVQVDSVSGTNVHFSIVVSKTPGHFTS